MNVKLDPKNLNSELSCIVPAGTPSESPDTPTCHGHSFHGAVRSPSYDCLLFVYTAVPRCVEGTASGSPKIGMCVCFITAVPCVFITVPVCVCVFITVVPITKLFAVCVFYYCRTYYKAVRVGGGGEWRTCAMRDDEPRLVWMSLLITH